MLGPALPSCCCTVAGMTHPPATCFVPTSTLLHCCNLCLNLQVAGAAADYPYNPQQPSYNPSSFGGPDSTGKLGEAARSSLSKATQAMSRYGWIGFWVQLTLSVVSGVILLFSVAFTSQVCMHAWTACRSSCRHMLAGVPAGDS